MKIKLIGLMVSLFLLAGTAVAQTFINLTPRPKSISVKAGQQLTLPSKFSISHSGLAEEEVNEVKRFADLYAAVTGAEVSVVADDADALFQVSKLDASSKLKDSGYTLAVTSDKVNIQAKSATGFFYAFQSVKKLLPANVMAGKKDPLATEHAIPTYTIPLVTISDEPRFDYRGFMLDVSRHFFTVDEVKRMLDVMSYYKMNAFHWHLTDDQGWRVEIKKYPKLTTVGSIAPNSLFTDLYEAKQYWINKPYGPYFYTQDEIRDVVAYAKERHITIVPEIDMPGHSSAAMASYPEYSCSPSGGHQVWSKGGISYDVINVANPAAVQFAKDVLSEIMDLFPGERIHIGGDECPVDAWKNNAECQALYKAKGFTNYRQLQSYFIQELSEFVKERGRKLAVWNEAITARRRFRSQRHQGHRCRSVLLESCPAIGEAGQDARFANGVHPLRPLLHQPQTGQLGARPAQRRRRFRPREEHLRMRHPCRSDGRCAGNVLDRKRLQRRLDGMVGTASPHRHRRARMVARVQQKFRGIPETHDSRHRFAQLWRL